MSQGIPKGCVDMCIPSVNETCCSENLCNIPRVKYCYTGIAKDNINAPTYEKCLGRNGFCQVRLGLFSN